MNYLDRVKRARTKFYHRIRLLEQGARMFSMEFYYTPFSESKIYLFGHELYKIKKFLEMCKKHLKLPDLWIQWIELDSKTNYQRFGGLRHKEPIYGLADLKDGNRIYIRADVPMYEILRTIAHESHHMWFCKKYGKIYPYSKKALTWENTAEEFEKKMLNMFWEDEQFDKDEGLQFLYATYNS